MADKFRTIKIFKKDENTQNYKQLTDEGYGAKRIVT